MEKVSPCPVAGCWWWAASFNRAGYGRFESDLAHRTAWRLLRGPIPPGLFVCHRCDQPGCVNPDHLFLGTHNDNMADKVAKGRAASGDGNGSRLYPERLRPQSGDLHFSRRAPDLMARGPRPAVRGENNPSARLSEDQVIAIRSGCASGKSQRSLASAYGVSKQLISAIVRRHCWSHLG